MKEKIKLAFCLIWKLYILRKQFSQMICLRKCQRREITRVKASRLMPTMTISREQKGKIYRFLFFFVAIAVTALRKRHANGKKKTDSQACAEYTPQKK
ncbi:hypothetical protein PUN28_003096 [Cardiocondyla obscurior]|uniref:Uncharacterized protein n=1 Tax=Cardiocondyla obscurior TaxID=286306 RepID=A0AAW2GLQ7_9HYME